jgi:hypothetical protein
VLAFGVVVLWLNVRERDLYARALPGMPAGPINQSPPPWLPPLDEITENLLWTRVEDADGWYRLLWAKADVYWFDDVSDFAGALRNATATNPTGRWTIQGKHAGKPFALAYALREGRPPEGAVEIGGIAAPRGVSWFTSEYAQGPRTFSWVLE